MSSPRIEPTAELRNRREARRRATRRHRAQATGLLALAIVVVAVVLLGGIGGSRSTKAPTQATAANHTALARGAGERRGRDEGGKRGKAARSTANANGGTGRVDGPPGKGAVPILMYHVIKAPPPGAPFPGLYVTPSEFAAQMRALKQAGWHAVTLDQVQAYWQRGTPLGQGKPIVLSFDNGYQSQYTAALPVMRRLGWVGDENLQLTGLPPSQGGLSEAQVKGLIAAGWELDTQGQRHADLTSLDAAELHHQVALARSTLQRRYHVPVNWFCYPSGYYNATVTAAVKEAGYTGSTTVVPGWASPSEDRYRLHRLRVLGGTSPEALLALIAGTREDPPAPSSYDGA